MHPPSSPSVVVETGYHSRTTTWAIQGYTFLVLRPRGGSFPQSSFVDGQENLLVPKKHIYSWSTTLCRMTPLSFSNMFAYIFYDKWWGLGLSNRRCCICLQRIDTVYPHRESSDLLHWSKHGRPACKANVKTWMKFAPTILNLWNDWRWHRSLPKASLAYDLESRESNAADISRRYLQV